ncbi:MAG: EAL domain-containing protein [Coriobacteriales bacterium]|nr:EAL domain-containing protein [Coriobacteriales bacterium]
MVLELAKRFLLGREFVSSVDEMNQENRLAIRYLAVMGIPVSLANVAAQSVIRGVPILAGHGGWMFAYFLALLFVDRFVLPNPCKRATLAIYVLEAPLILISILLGTVWDPTHQAVTFLLVLMVAPVFVLDRPLRLMGIMLGWVVLFLVICFLVKDPYTIEADMVHVMEFTLASLAVTSVVLRLRMRMLRSLDRTIYHLNHDTLTGTRNRRSFETNASRYVGSPLFVAFGDIDNFTLLSDFYGHEISDELMRSFAFALRNSFGNMHTYRYEGDEFLCFATNRDLQDCLAGIDACREALKSTKTKAMYSNVTASFGYVVGTPKDVAELHNMVRLADINTHKAKKTGVDKVEGGPYDNEALRAGIVASNLSTHARSYEVNQLTGLPSMTYFITRSQELLQHVADLQMRPMVGYLNLVHFHSFNDEFGYERGDELIRHTADVLRENLKGRHIAYITGSQFVVLCYLDEVEPFLQEVQRDLGVYCAGHPVYVCAGFAEYTLGDSVISLIDEAKIAHDNTKEDALYRIYDAELDEAEKLRQHIIANLDKALDEGWLKVYYQPIVSSATGRVCELEALSRWDDPEYGFLSPFHFIGTLEKENLTYKLSLHVVRQVLHDFDELRRLGIEPVPVSINLSRTDFYRCDMVREITALVDKAGCEHRLIHLEVTESAFVNNQEFLRNETERFKAAGFEVWMDDFGSEYSTLNLLEELDFDLVKIDMRFMRNFAPEGRNAIIVANIIAMCKQLGMSTLVEGVETVEQSAILRGFGCDLLQGYLFSKPQPLNGLLSFILGERHW